jgi:hypothetical protein
MAPDVLTAILRLQRILGWVAEPHPPTTEAVDPAAPIAHHHHGLM